MKDSTDIPPNSLEAERAVLGCCLLDPPCLLMAIDGLVEEDFFHPSHKILFRAMERMFTKSISVDYVTITQVLIKTGNLNTAGGPDYIAGITNVVPSIRNAEYYIDIVSDTSRRRKIEKLGVQLKSAANSEQETDELIENAMGMLLEIRKRKGDTQLMDLNVAIEKHNEYLDELKALGRPPGLLFGIRAIDDVTGGIEPGEVAILAARPSIGKTALAATIARHVSQAGGKVLFVSAEMTYKGLAARYISMVTGANLYDIRTGRRVVHTEEHSELKAFVQHQPQILLYEAWKPTDMSVRTAVQLAAHKRKGLDLVIIDYLQLIRPRDTSIRTKNEKIEEVSANIKAMAQEPGIRCPFLVLSQLSRGMTKEDRRPRLDDLRDSGAIEQDADMVFLMHKKPQENVDPMHLVELDVAKNRQGRVSVREQLLEFHRKVVTFSDSDEMEREAYFRPRG